MIAGVSPHLTTALAACLGLGAGTFVATIMLLAVPVTHAERRLWHALGVDSLRRRITRRRNVAEPYHEQLTVRIARRNLWWHLLLTGLFTSQIAWAWAAQGSWWRPLAVPLVIFCIAYLAGSLVQRQKIAIVQQRRRRSARRD